MQDVTPGFHFVDLSDTGVIFYYLDATALRAGLNGSFEFLLGIGGLPLAINSGGDAFLLSEVNKKPTALLICGAALCLLFARRVPWT